VRELPGARTPLLQTLALAYLGASALMLGIYATFFPRGFYDDFPLGRGWVAADGPFNEHLVRDFGGLNLGLGLVLVVAAAVGGRVLVRTAALASLLFAVPHLVHHLRNRHALDGIDAVASPATLVVGVAVALAVLALEPQARRPAATGSFSDRTTPGATSSVMASNE